MCFNSLVWARTFLCFCTASNSLSPLPSLYEDNLSACALFHSRIRSAMSVFWEPGVYHRCPVSSGYTWNIWAEHVSNLSHLLSLCPLILSLTAFKFSSCVVLFPLVYFLTFSWYTRLIWHTDAAILHTFQVQMCWVPEVFKPQNGASLSHWLPAVKHVLFFFGFFSIFCMCYKAVIIVQELLPWHTATKRGASVV